MVDKSNENIMGASAYLLFAFTGILFLMMEKESKFVRFHALQSTMTFTGIFVLAFALQIIPLLGPIISFSLIFGGFILWLVCMWKAFQGEIYKVPYIGDVAERQVDRMKQV